MSPRICISLLVLQLSVFVFSAETNECISFKSDVQHPHYKPKKLKLECRLENCDDSLYTRPQFIKISKTTYEGDVLLASIEKYKNEPTGTAALGKGPKVSGSMADRENTYLAIRWERADKDAETTYTCSISVTDDYGQKRTLQGKVKVALDEPPKDDPRDERIKQLEDDLSDCNETSESLEQQVAALQKDLADQAAQCNATLRAQRDSLAEIFFLPEPLAYSGKRYFMSRNPYLNDEESDAVCNVVGGYLVEINDADEYQAVVRYVKSKRAPGALISGTDDEREGVWVYHRSKRPVEYLNWKRGEPNNLNGRENCIVIWGDAGDLMNDTVCKSNPYRYPFICEVDEKNSSQY
ncbi:hypothetical protein Btru_005065 [Bulinus truncatus]|nr:hypothetical protein Btru_005065 [Bulinus truncatus]